MIKIYVERDRDHLTIYKKVFINISKLQRLFYTLLYNKTLSVLEEVSTTRYEGYVSLSTMYSR